MNVTVYINKEGIRERNFQMFAKFCPADSGKFTISCVGSQISLREIDFF